MSAEGKPVPIDKNLIARDFAANAKGKLSQVLIDSITESLRAETSGFPAKGLVTAATFFLRFHLEMLADHMIFDGTAGGLGGMSPAMLVGDVYTNDLPKLYANTVKFGFQGTQLYISLQFYDANDRVLGVFQGAGGANVNGAGGGPGHWSPA